MRRAAEAIWSVLRKLLKTTIALGAIVFVLLFVPVWPFFPECVTKSRGYEHIVRYMSDDYRHLLKKNFRDFGVYYWDIGGIVFVRVLPFMDGVPLFGHDDGIVNAESRAAWSLAGTSFADSYEGRELNGRIYRAPDFIRRLVADHPESSPHEQCDVMPYIVTMTPPPEKPTQ